MKQYVRRQYFRRFLRPINRLELDPGVVSRTMVVGVGWGLSPLVGFQLIGLGLTWVVLARMLRRSFNLPIAALLTAITNPLTVPPIYTIYYATGCATIDCSGTGAQLSALITTIAEVRLSDLFSGDTLVAIAEPLGIIVVGALPYMLVGCVAARYLGLYVGQSLAQRRADRNERRRTLDLGRFRLPGHGGAHRPTAERGPNASCVPGEDHG